jgi:hypothetical protein
MLLYAGQDGILGLRFFLFYFFFKFYDFDHFGGPPCDKWENRNRKSGISFEKTEIIFFLLPIFIVFLRTIWATIIQSGNELKI